MHHIQIVGGFTEVKHSWILEAIHRFVVYIHYWGGGKLNFISRLVKTELQFFPIQVHGPLWTLKGLGVPG